MERNGDMIDKQLEFVLQLGRKEAFLNKVIVWLKTKKLWNECVKDCGEEQLMNERELNKAVCQIFIDYRETPHAVPQKIVELVQQKKGV